MRTLTLVSLIFGLASTGALFLAVATDYWLYTSEPVNFEEMIMEGQADIAQDDFPPDTLDGVEEEMFMNESAPIMLPTEIKLHSGLWRVCIYYEGMDYPSSCATIGYGQTWERVDGGDTTNSILRSMRRSSPIVVVSLLILIIALGFSTVGNTKKNNKTVFGAVLYVIGALTLAMGVIFYISAVNDEVSHRKKPPPNAPEGSMFHYHYGWAFFFAAAAFICSLMAAVTNITLYIKRFPHLEDMALIIPGLEKRGGFGFVSSKSEDFESESGMNNHTIVL